MPIIEPVIRPPAEANSILLQITTSCSANSCTFCGAYKDKRFTIKSKAEIYADIDMYATHYPDARKVFLMDGDALVVGNKKIVPILKKLNEVFPKLTRIASYANGYNIMKRTKYELQELIDYKLNLIYLGLESGNQQILNDCNKRSTVKEMISAVQLADEIGIKSSVIVLLGLGGKKNSELHVKDTIVALNKMQPRFLSFLSLMLVPNTKLYQEYIDGSFQQLDQTELLQETFSILQGLELNQTIFRTNHASNYLPLEGRLPKDKAKLVYVLKTAVQGDAYLRPEILRGL